MIAELDRQWRLRLGLAVVAALLWLFILLELSDHLSALRSSETQLATQVTRMKLMSREEQWPEFRDRVNRRLSEFRGRAWREESEGLVQAQLQDWLSAKMTASGLKARELAVSLPSALPEGAPVEMRVVRARVVFDFHSEAFHALMTEISGEQRWVWVERLAVRNWGTPSVELELGALFVIGPRDQP